MRAPARRRILTFHERQALQAEAGIGPLGLEAADVGTGGVWYQAPHALPMNPAELELKRRQVRTTLEAGSPQDNTPAYKRWRDKRIRELEDALRTDVVPQGHFHLKRQDTTDYHKVVSTLVDQMTNNKRRAMEDELKNLRREREPEDPNAGKIVDLRTDRRIVA